MASRTTRSATQEREPGLATDAGEAGGAAASPSRVGGPSSTDAAGAPPRLLRIHEAAAAAGLTTRAVRYYEEVGLLSPAARSEGAYRLYDPSDVERLRAIKELRDVAGFSLAEIRELLDDETLRQRNRERLKATADPAEQRAILEETLRRLERRIAILRAKADRLAAMIAEAEERRRHLEGHLAELAAGLPLGAGGVAESRTASGPVVVSPPGAASPPRGG
jgi:DNA-binding transcriptional MerR regulator